MRIRPQTEILSRMMDYTNAVTSKVTDFTVGSAIRAMYDAYSIELEALYMLTAENIETGIEEGLISAFGFETRPAQRAYGDLTISLYSEMDTPTLIARGTTFRSSDPLYTTTYQAPVDYYIPANVRVYTIRVVCTEEGLVGNIPANKITIMDTGIRNFSGATNDEAFLTGREAETYEQAKHRFQLFIEAIGRGTKQSLKYGAYTVPEITGVFVDEKVGIAYVYCHDSNGDLPDDIREEVIKAEENYRPAGIELLVLPVNKIKLDITLTVIMNDSGVLTDRYKSDLISFVEAYLNSFAMPRNLILADLTQAIMNYDDVNIYDCAIMSPSGNIITQNNELIRAGKIDITYR